MTTKRKSLWLTLKEQAAADDLDEILAMSDAELDASIAKEGGDPAAIRARGAALAKELDERRTATAWHADEAAKHEAFRATAAAHKSKTVLPRAELMARLNAARNNPKFAAPVATLFQKKTEEAATDEELQDLLDRIELLAKLEDE